MPDAELACTRPDARQGRSDRRGRLLRRIRGRARRHGHRRRLRDRGPRRARQAPAAGARLIGARRGWCAGARRAGHRVRRRGGVRRRERRRGRDPRRPVVRARALLDRRGVGDRAGQRRGQRRPGGRSRARADGRLSDGVHGRRGRRVRRPGRHHDQRRHDGPPRAARPAAGRDPAARLPRRRRRGADPGVEIGEEAFVAAGAVVTRDVPRARSSWASRHASCARCPRRTCSSAGAKGPPGRSVVRPAPRPTCGVDRRHDLVGLLAREHRGSSGSPGACGRPARCRAARRPAPHSRIAAWRCTGVR